MIIKFIPETEAEKVQLSEQVYTGVNEFFVFGNRQDEEGRFVDFHNWRGQHRYLIGSLAYYSNVIDDERREKAIKSNSDGIVRQFAKKNAEVEIQPPFQMIDTPVENLEENQDNKDVEVDDVQQFPVAGFDLNKE